MLSWLRGAVCAGGGVGGVLGARRWRVQCGGGAGGRGAAGGTRLHRELGGASSRPPQGPPPRFHRPLMELRCSAPPSLPTRPKLTYENEYTCRLFIIDHFFHFGLLVCDWFMFFLLLSSE
jgi:hypothetical protein